MDAQNMWFRILSDSANHGFLRCGLGAVYLGRAQLLLFCAYTDSSPALVPV